ncbi:ATP-binding protein [Pseudoalteromonas prydzensis]
MIVFQDNGSGIDNAILKDIFTPFYSTNPGGNHLGLGLNVVFNAVKYNLFGNICAEPCQHGARFIITLPIDGPQAAKQRDET